MISVSDAWKDKHTQTLLPETFIEITCGITDVGSSDEVVVTGTNEAAFSNTAYVVKSTKNVTPKKYATFEKNMWVLDGTCNLPERQTDVLAPGYVNECGDAVLTIRLPEIRESTIPGFTITWSETYNEYPVSFSITAKNGNTVVATTTVTDNTSTVSTIPMEVAECDTIVIEVHEWIVPDHRVRIDLVSFGQVVTFTKNDIMSFTHEQQGSLISGEIPKNSIEFTVDNSDGRWSLNNPTGIERYLTERQPVVVKYGLDVNGKVEWIPGGKFYLSEWRTSANSLEATFAARDVFEYLLESKCSSVMEGTLKEIAENMLRGRVPEDCVVNIDDSLSKYTATTDAAHTAAEVVQMCANGSGCVIRYDRDGNLNIETLKRSPSGYHITKEFSYSHPELTLSKHMKEVSVAYGENTRFVLGVSDMGETQTVDNAFVTSVEQAAVVAECVRDALETRKSVNGEFRADPRLDLFDIVRVDGKYGTFFPVVITNIKYVYNGAFKATFGGVILKCNNVLGQFILGKSTLGG
jgi:hypothetical protein